MTFPYGARTRRRSLFCRASDFADVERKPRVDRVIATGVGYVHLVECKLFLGQVGHGYTRPKPREFDREPAGTGTNLEDAVTRPDALGEEPSMQLEAHPGARRIVSRTHSVSPTGS